MSSSIPAQTHDLNLDTDTHGTKSLDPKIGENTRPPQNDSPLGENQEINEVEGEEEEESECGFCLYMKAGGCKDPFIEWEKCLEEGEKNKEDIPQKFYSVTKALKDCMEAHPDHYAPILKAEKAAEEEAVRALENELEKEGNVESSSKPEVEIKQSGLVAESVAMIEVEEIPN